MNKMTDEQKKWIDNANYEALLSKWRFAPLGDPLFTGECGDYFLKIFFNKKKEIGNAKHSGASKKIGWN